MYILAFIIALLASFLLTPYVKQLAVKIGAVDQPDKRKVHTHVMPRLGGLAIFLAFVLAVACSLPITRDLLGILLGGVKYLYSRSAQLYADTIASQLPATLLISNIASSSNVFR